MNQRQVVESSEKHAHSAPHSTIQSTATYISAQRNDAGNTSNNHVIKSPAVATAGSCPAVVNSQLHLSSANCKKGRSQMSKTTATPNNDATAEPLPGRSHVIMSAAGGRSEPFDPVRRSTNGRSSVGSISVPAIATHADHLLIRGSSAQAHDDVTPRDGDVVVKGAMERVYATAEMGGVNPAGEVGAVNPEGEVGGVKFEGEVGGVHPAEEGSGANPGGEVGVVNASQQSDGGQQNKGKITIL